MYLEAQKSLYINNTKKYLDIESEREKWENCVQFRAYLAVLC